MLYDYNSAIAGFADDQVGAALGTFGLRAASGIFSHSLYSALFCCGLVFAIGTAAQPRRLGLGIGLMVLAMVTHGTWDAIGAIGGSAAFGFFGVVAFSVFSLVMLFFVMRRTAVQERAFLRAVLEPEVVNGTITQAELDGVCASRRQRKKYLRSGKGRKAQRSAQHVVRASFDLAHEIALARGADSPGVAHERAEIARLRAAPAV